nr:proline-rich receptor-like protein kinase PERK9 [Aegilops tauschii subsp. strangulata]
MAAIARALPCAPRAASLATAHRSRARPRAARDRIALLLRPARYLRLTLAYLCRQSHLALCAASGHRPPRGSSRAVAAGARPPGRAVEPLLGQCPRGREISPTFLPPPPDFDPPALASLIRPPPPPPRLLAASPPPPATPQRLVLAAAPPPDLPELASAPPPRFGGRPAALPSASGPRPPRRPPPRLPPRPSDPVVRLPASTPRPSPRLRAPTASRSPTASPSAPTAVVCCPVLRV